MDMARHSCCQFCKHLLRSWGGCYNDCCIDGNRFEAVVTPEKFAKDMIRIKSKYEDDPEECHRKMDKLMCETLELFGYEPDIKVFKDADKWYV